MNLWNIYHPETPQFLQDAAATPTMQRLKGIGMNCGCEYTSFPSRRNYIPYSRFDHSLGVALIIWHFTADPAQAMAGLLHDISTPVFAHVIDFLHGDHMHQESTESATAQFIAQSDSLAQVLSRCHLSLEAVSDYHRYPIADNDSPKLSADRLEYTLGNGVNYGFISTEEAARLYQDLTVGVNEYGEPELVFRHAEIAKSFAELSLRCSKVYVSDEDRYAMQMLAELLKSAIDNGVLQESDLYLQERDVIRVLTASSYASRWDEYCHYQRIICRDTPEGPGAWRQINSKKRHINPLVQNQGRVTSLFPDYHRDLTAFLAKSMDDWILAI